MNTNSTGQTGCNCGSGSNSGSGFSGDVKSGVTSDLISAALIAVATWIFGGSTGGTK